VLIFPRFSRGYPREIPRVREQSVRENPREGKSSGDVRVFVVVEQCERNIDYVVCNKVMMETVLDAEFKEPIEKGFFYSGNALLDRSFTISFVICYMYACVHISIIIVIMAVISVNLFNCFKKLLKYSALNCN